jgi:hypothetical protein
MYTPHAYLIRYGEPPTKGDITSYIHTHITPLDSGDEVYSFTYDEMFHDDAQNFLSIIRTKPYTSKRIVIATIHRIKLVTQQILLTGIEEARNQCVCIIMPRSNPLMPAFVSRFQVHEISSTPHTSRLKEAENFLDASQSKRLKIVDTLIKEYKKEVIDMTQVRLWFSDLVSAVRARYPDRPQYAQPLLSAIRELHYDGASLKILAEYIACALPLSQKK